MQTYGKYGKNSYRLIILFQYGIFERYQLGCFGQLSVLFLCRFRNKQPRSGHQIINAGEQGKEDEEHRSNEECTIEGPGQEYDTNHDQVDGDKGQGDRPMRETAVQQ